MSGRCRSLSAVLGLIALQACGTAVGHDARPLSIGIVEQSPGLYRAVVRVPPTLEAGNTPRIVWPNACALQQASTLRNELGSVSLLSCPTGIEGNLLDIIYPVYNPSITTLVRLTRVSGEVSTAVLPPSVTSFRVPTQRGWGSIVGDYLVLGLTHILGGPDHLLLVAGLMLLARRPRRILVAVTGFTLAHSITLALAALGWVRLPIAPVEALIALSVLFLAAELGRADSKTFGHRYPITLAFVFGLLHGLGFASALREVGLPPSEVATGLVSFNIGVELGQLAFIGAVAIPTVAWLRWCGLQNAERAAALRTISGQIATYVLGIPAAFWFFERTVSAFG